MKIGSPTGVKELNEEQLDQMNRGALDANTPVETDFDESFGTVMTLPMVITDEGLGDIIQIHVDARYKKLEEGQTPRSIKSSMTKTYRCNVKNGHDVTVIQEPEMTTVIDIINAVLPDMHDFGMIIHGVIHEFSSGSWIDWRIENEDMNDSATCFIQLNDTFDGGEFSIEPGTTLNLPRGSFFGFNNCTTTVYNMKPVYMGDRYLLQLFFQRPTEQDIFHLTHD
tara:strand:+ start:3200 stop:3871 length:672 start_codon:yes stop_codon:yes gene_type:complete